MGFNTGVGYARKPKNAILNMRVVGRYVMKRRWWKAAVR